MSVAAVVEESAAAEEEGGGLGEAFGVRNLEGFGD